MKLLTILTVMVYITNSIIDMPYLQYVADRLFSTTEGQALLVDMAQADVFITVDGMTYGSGFIEVAVIGHDITTGANGEYFYDQRLIRLDEKDFKVRTTRALMSTLAHEIQHAIDFETGHVCNTEQRAQLRAASIFQNRLIDVDDLSSNCSD